ncbi:V-type ATP synthase subunit E family protein [Anaerococcus lactolyticus]|uniref:ATPase n=1 Tax=Anaerococcus lactolyticus S7-1-13 TaxID=1284686 RepID=A0A095X252_9FIRM|nr:V-type ATP synthase subunit E family protein [Anaerococcus lactolyticus]KGF04155.1 ATPase [Anaerococcus lactolyticus S7-1-13]
MLDLEAKLSSFRKMVWDEEKLKTDNELFLSTEKNSSYIDDKNKQRNKEFEEKIKDRKNFLKIRKNEEISKIKQEEKNDFYAYREELLDDFYNRLITKLRAYKKTDAYKKSLQEDIKKMMKALNLSEDEIVVCVLHDDLDLIDFKNKQAIDKTYIGGFILKDINNEFRYNFSYKERIRDRKYEFGKKLYQVLESERFNESNN